MPNITEDIPVLIFDKSKKENSSPSKNSFKNHKSIPDRIIISGPLSPLMLATNSLLNAQDPNYTPKKRTKI